MNNNPIIIPKECQYLSEFYSELPKNCLFNKGATGAGGTTIALIDHNPTVICVPSIELINNKVLQVQENKKDLYPYNLLGVYSKTSDLEITNFLERNDTPKIMVTYDSLGRIAELIDPSVYNILVDEYHSLFIEYSFRKKAVLTVLNNYQSFKNFTFMSATPIEEEFLLEELKDIKIENVVWENVIDVIVKPVKCDKGIIETVKTLIERVLSDELEGNYYFFVNSVSFIEKILKNCDLNNTNCRVIYSDDNRRVLTVKRGKTTDPPKRINFLTKTAFQGCDIYDEDGKICILSDGNLAHTLIDISTQFLQIAGRIRNSKYKDAIFHIYTNTRYTGLASYKEFKAMVERSIKEDDSFFEDILKLKPENKMKAAEGKLTYYTVDMIAGTIEPDKNKQKIDLYNYKILNEVYISKVNLGNEYKKNGLSTNLWHTDHSNPEILPMDDVTNFKHTVITLKDMCKGNLLFGDFDNYEFDSYKAAACRQYNFLNQALQLLGFEGIEKSNYGVTNIKKKIFRLTNTRTSETSDLQVISRFFETNKLFKTTGAFITIDSFKKALNGYYKELGIQKKATSNDVDNYFVIEKLRRRINGVQQRVMVILAKKSMEECV